MSQLLSWQSATWAAQLYDPTKSTIKPKLIGLQSDYPAEVAGAIALISRGTCEFGQKSALAGNAGAVGAAIYNNIPGGLNGTLGQPRALGPYVPTVGISQEAGLALVDVIAAGTEVTGALDVVSEIEFRSTYVYHSCTSCVY